MNNPTTATVRAHSSTRLLVIGLVQALGDPVVRPRAADKVAYHLGTRDAYRVAAQHASLNDQATLAGAFQLAADQEDGKRQAWKDYLDTDPKVLADQARQALAPAAGTK